MNPDDIRSLFGIENEADIDRLSTILAWVDVQWRTKRRAYPDDSPGGDNLQDKLKDEMFRTLLKSALNDEQWSLELPEEDF